MDMNIASTAAFWGTDARLPRWRRALSFKYERETSAGVHEEKENTPIRGIMKPAHQKTLGHSTKVSAAACLLTGDEWRAAKWNVWWNRPPGLSLQSTQKETKQWMANGQQNRTWRFVHYTWWHSFLYPKPSQTLLVFFTPKVLQKS